MDLDVRFREFLGKAEHGTVVIELALIAPVLVLLAIATVDLGGGIYRNMQVHNAAQAGAEYAVAHGFDGSLVASAAMSATTFAGITASPTQFCGCAVSGSVSNVSCGSTCPDGSASGTYVTVAAQASYTTLLPYPLFPSSFVLTAQSTVRTQ